MQKYINCFSIFKKGLDYGGLSDKLSLPENSFTVFAPTDQAFARMNKKLFDESFDKEESAMEVELLQTLTLHNLVKRL